MVYRFGRFSVYRWIKAFVLFYKIRLEYHVELISPRWLRSKLLDTFKALKSHRVYAR